MPDLPITTRFGLLRHAETEWNKQKRIQGHSDSPLTAAGRASADQWGSMLKTLPFNRIVSSDLGRAMDTACTINRHLKLPVIEEIGLREQYWGRWEGLSTSEIESTDDFIKVKSSGWKFRPLEGENREEVWQRGHDALLSIAAKWPNDTILVTTHEGVIRCIINGLSNRKFRHDEPRLIKSEHLHWLIHRNGQLELEEINALSL